jgi:hypothetical protein
VTAAKEREGRERKKGGRKKSSVERLCVLKGVNLDGALLFYKGTSMGDALPSIVMRAGCHGYTPRRQLRWPHVVLLWRQVTWRHTIEFRNEISFPIGVYIKNIF